MPKFYLRGFANADDRLIRVPLGGDAHPQSINDATVQKDYYTVSREGVEPDDFEIALGEIEQVAAPVFREILSGKGWPLTDEDRHKLSTWIALQHLRGESIRRSGEEVYRAMAKLKVGTYTTKQFRAHMRLDETFTDEQAENIRARMLATADNFKVDHHQHLALIMQMLEGMTNIVFNRRPWHLIEFTRKAIGTSDTPVVMRPGPQNVDLGVGIALGTAGELLVPLGRRKALILGELGGKGEDTRRAGNALGARAFNSEIAWNSRSAAYRPDDSPFDMERFPSDPRMAEMSISGAHIDELIEGLAQKQGRQSGLSEKDGPTRQ